MASVVDICNLALGNIRANSINALDESSIEAQVCNQRYDFAVDFVLNAFPWGFAKKVATLALLDESPQEWTYAYSYPNECINIRHLVANEQISTDRTALLRYDQDEFYQRQQNLKTRIPFEIAVSNAGSKAILCNQAEAWAAYTVRVTDPNQFDAGFIEALAWYLSSVIAIPVVGADKGAQLQATAVDAYQSFVNIAKASSANERWNTSSIPESPTITARR